MRTGEDEDLEVLANSSRHHLPNGRDSWGVFQTLAKVLTTLHHDRSQASVRRSKKKNLKRPKLEVIFRKLFAFVPGVSVPDFFSKFIKKALGKSSTSEEENHDNQNMDEGTDTEQHESLPEDLVSVKDSKLQSRFDFPRAILSKKNSQKSTSESSDKNARPVPAKKEMRQDSGSSVWSDNIPVITISKTESAECLDVVPEVAKAEPVSELPKFKPKIKCVLKKQSAEIDEDVIRHFSKDLDLKPGLEEHLEKDVGAISESSDDTARESSTDTVLAVKVEDKEEEAKTGANGVELSSSTTESSTEYNDNMSL